MDFFELLSKRRSIREFEDKEVPRELIEAVIDDGIKAPNGGNRQPWSFIIITDRACIKKLSDASKKIVLEIIEKDPGFYMKRYETALRNEEFNVFHNAPCLIYICGLKDQPSLVEDCGLLVSYLMLSATSRGLGTCWIGMGGRIKDPEILEEIGLPGDYRIVAPIIVGYPKSIPVMPERKEAHILKYIS